MDPMGQLEIYLTRKETNTGSFSSLQELGSTTDLFCGEMSFPGCKSKSP